MWGERGMWGELNVEWRIMIVGCEKVGGGGKSVWVEMNMG